MLYVGAMGLGHKPSAEDERQASAILRLTLSVEDDGDDESVDTQDTRHDNGDDRLEDEFGLEDTHAADADTALSGTVGSTEV